MDRLHKKTILLTSLRILSIAINSDENNRREVLVMDGVQLMHEIVKHILNQSESLHPSY